MSKRRTIPDWMTPYLDLIGETGGNPIEQLINGTANVVINAPLAICEVSVYAQWALLLRLHKRGLLKDGRPQ